MSSATFEKNQCSETLHTYTVLKKVFAHLQFFAKVTIENKLDAIDLYK